MYVRAIALVRCNKVDLHYRITASPSTRTVRASLTGTTKNDPPCFGTVSWALDNFGSSVPTYSIYRKCLFVLTGRNCFQYVVFQHLLHSLYQSPLSFFDTDCKEDLPSFFLLIQYSTSGLQKWML